ncbi:MAG: sugar ABC transporter substrate-binding protein, partial [Proteobacteria bacterium]|nr:sugar ABC transporter substrate-binding protein [Pseudomonadota bacterium]
DALQDYLGVPLQNADGSFYDRNLDADYLSWIGTLRQAHEAGYIPDDAFADDGTVFEEKIKTGRYATIFLNGLAQMGGAMQTWLTAHPDSEYIAVQGPASTVGNKPTLNQSGITGWMVNYISKKAKDPVKAMQVFTYLQSEYGQMLTTFGIEGETFTWTPDRKVLLLPDAAKMKSDDNERFKQEYRLQEFIFFGHDRYKALSDPSMLVKATVQPMEWGAKYLVPHFILERADPASGTVEARNLTAINAQWSTTLVSMIRGSQADEQTTLQAYKDFLAANGWDAIVKVRTENMAQARKLFGIN